MQPFRAMTHTTLLRECESPARAAAGPRAGVRRPELMQPSASQDVAQEQIGVGDAGAGVFVSAVAGPREVGTVVGDPTSLVP